MRDLLVVQPEQLSRPRGCRDCELNGMIEPLRHDRYDGGEPALDLISDRKGKHEVLAGRICVLRGCQDGTKIVAGMTQSSRRHIAVEKVDISDQSRVEQGSLIRRRLTAANQRARSAGPILRKLVAQRCEWRSRKRSDRATQAIQNVSLVELARVGLQRRRNSSIGKTSDRIYCRGRYRIFHQHVSVPGRFMRLIWFLSRE